jgi:hypothetical protein
MGGGAMRLPASAAGGHDARERARAERGRSAHTTAFRVACPSSPRAGPEALSHTTVPLPSRPAAAAWRLRLAAPDLSRSRSASSPYRMRLSASTWKACWCTTWGGWRLGGRAGPNCGAFHAVVAARCPRSAPVSRCAAQNQNRRNGPVSPGPHRLFATPLTSLVTNMREFRVRGGGKEGGLRGTGVGPGAMRAWQPRRGRCCRWLLRRSRWSPVSGTADCSNAACSTRPAPPLLCRAPSPARPSPRCPRPRATCRASSSPRPSRRPLPR